METQSSQGVANPVTAALLDLHARLKPDIRGQLASYIPELSTADPQQFGISLVSVEGHLYQAGDAAAPFTIQSVSKPFVYALALADRGTDEVRVRVGVEPSGEPFNAISLEPETGRPANPMINAGAIVTGSLVRAAGASERFERIRDMLSKFAGRKLVLDERVYKSELETGDRNRALAYLMRNTGLLQSPVDDAIDVYFRQCALLVTAKDLGVMAATLANGGVNPCTGVRVVEPEIAEHVLSVMATCGMYDYSGEWLLHVGLPAKSGVAGGLVAVSPSQFGIGVFSPLVDDRGNSIRAIAACRELSDEFRIHLMHHTGRAAAAIHGFRSGGAIQLARVRRRRERDTLLAHGDAIHAIGLQGDLEFAAAENIVWALTNLAAGRRENPDWLVLDLRRVTRIHPVAAGILNQAIADPGLFSRTTVVTVGASPGLLTAARMEKTSMEDALEWCEDELLERYDALPKPGPMPLREHDVMASLDPRDRDELGAALVDRSCGVGDRVFDDPDEFVYLVLSGRFAAYERASRTEAPRRLATFGAGTAFYRSVAGESGGGRDYVAVLPTSAMVLTGSALALLEQKAPAVVGRFWRAMMAFADPFHCSCW